MCINKRTRNNSSLPSFHEFDNFNLHITIAKTNQNTPYQKYNYHFYSSCTTIPKLNEARHGLQRRKLTISD